jgi:type II secretory pathway pseudopilin PulG
VLLLLLLILGVLGASFAVHTLRGQDAARESQTSQALARAKQALIGYAVTYRDSHAGELSGYLPLPDLGSSRNNNLTPAEGNAAANFSGNGTNRSVAGRLPWKTLELAALRDGRGECLWYAVSGAFQNVVKSTPMNWDSLGQFDPYASQGTPASTLSTVGSRVHQRPIAAVMAPGARLPGQDRSATTSDAVTECGGNYDAANYLDSVSPTPLIANIVNYLDGIHHASGTYPVAAPKQLALGPVLAPDGSTLVNDRLLTLGSDELFREIKKRRDFKTDIDTLLGWPTI